MTFFAIGSPGQAVRVIIGASSIEEASTQLQSGEVAAPVSGPGAYVMAEDGLSAERLAVSQDGLWHRIRCERYAKLAASDAILMSDRPMAPETREAWQTYRQALRDITDFPTPADVVWPTAPGSSNA